MPSEPARGNCARFGIQAARLTSFLPMRRKLNRRPTSGCACSGGNPAKRNPDMAAMRPVAARCPEEGRPLARVARPAINGMGPRERNVADPPKCSATPPPKQRSGRSVLICRDHVTGPYRQFMEVESQTPASPGREFAGILPVARGSRLKHRTHGPTRTQPGTRVATSWCAAVVLG
jgi:hypothetical protein